MFSAIFKPIWSTIWSSVWGAFSPLSLFAASEQGGWYDAEDMSTLYQDAAGTTPVTAVEQPVGLWLDKSRGLVLGPELAPAPSALTAASIDNAGGSVSSFSGGVLNVTTQSSLADYPRLRINIPGISAGRLYAVTVRATWTGAITQVTARLAVSGAANNIGVITASGNTISGRAVAATAGQIEIFPAGANTGPWSLTITEISVRELPGNHATQSTTVSRPVWSARYNLLQRTEQFDDAAWFKTNATVTANTATAPDGTTTGDSVDFTSTTPPAPSVRIFQDTSSTTVNGQRYIGSIWMRADSNRTVDLVVERSGPADQQSVQCSVTTQWQRFQITHTGVWTGSSSARLTVINPSQTGVIFMWGAQLILAADQLSTGNRYQRVGNGAVGSADYDTTGFRHYLRFDGGDDSVATASIDFSATDKVTVWAGLTKLSDAARGMLVELGNGITNRFSIEAPDAGLGNFVGLCGGTLQASISVAGVAPATRVLTLQNDIAADNLNLRVNGNSNISTGDQGTGTHANAPLFIGRRNNSSLPFNGRIYGLIVRGAQSSAGEIAATEAWLNQRTGAY